MFSCQEHIKRPPGGRDCGRERSTATDIDQRSHAKIREDVTSGEGIFVLLLWSRPDDDSGSRDSSQLTSDRSHDGAEEGTYLPPRRTARHLHDPAHLLVMGARKRAAHGLGAGRSPFYCV